MDKTNPPRLITSGVMAQNLNVPLHRVLRILRTRPHIVPAAYAGNVRLYDAAAIVTVRQELAAVDARRCTRQEVSIDG